MASSRRIQFSIRSLLCITILSAFAIAIWLGRPSGEMLIEIGPNGTIQLDGKTPQNNNLAKQLGEKIRWHNLWCKECKVVIAASESTAIESVSEMIQEVQMVGGEHFSLRISSEPDSK